jgi:hypothetical protein
MNRIVLLFLVTILQPGFSARAEDNSRIKKKPPTPVEVERIASESAMNDGLLQKGDIVVTDRLPAVSGIGVRRCRKRVRADTEPSFFFQKEMRTTQPVSAH